MDRLVVSKKIYVNIMDRLVVSKKIRETFGCMYAATFGCKVCAFWVQACGYVWVQSMRLLGASFITAESLPDSR